MKDKLNQKKQAKPRVEKLEKRATPRTIHGPGTKEPGRLEFVK